MAEIQTPPILLNSEENNITSNSRELISEHLYRSSRFYWSFVVGQLQWGWHRRYRDRQEG